MNVVLSNIERQLDDPSLFSVTIFFGDSAAVEYRASYDDSDSRARFCNVERELFMKLSNLAHKRFGDCVIYQMELMSIIGAFASDDLDLALPAQLGTTQYCWLKPTYVKVLRNKLSCWYTMIKWRFGIDRPRKSSEVTGTENAG